MSTAPRILGFSGSLREGSYNQRLVRIAAAGAEAAGADVTVIDLRDLPLPVYSADLEQAEGLPANCLKLKELMRPADGLLIASPENNSSLSSALKNAIDWASRPAPDEPRLACFQGKVAGIMAASPGGLGGLRGLVHLRAILQNVGVMVVPDQRAVGGAGEAFAGDGSLADETLHGAIEAIGARVATVAGKLKS